MSGEERARIFSRYYGVYHEAGRLAEAYLRMAQTYAASGYFRNAATLLRRAGEVGEAGGGAVEAAEEAKEAKEPEGVYAAPEVHAAHAAPVAVAEQEASGSAVPHHGGDGAATGGGAAAGGVAAATGALSGRALRAEASFTRWQLAMWRLLSCRSGVGMQPGEEPCVGFGFGLALTITLTLTLTLTLTTNQACSTARSSRARRARPSRKSSTKR